MTYPRRRTDSRSPLRTAQRGAAALLVTVLIVLALGLTIALSARVMHVAQRRASNDYQTQQACAAAQAGLATGLRRLGSRRRLDMSFDEAGWTYLDGPSSSLSDGAAFSVVYTNEGLRPFDTETVWIKARGHSAQGSGECSVRQLLRSRKAFDHLPQTPIVAKDGIRLTGAIDITNARGRTAAWAGGTIAADRITVQLGQTPPRNICDTHGLCMRDARLARLNLDAFFNNFLAYPPAGIKAYSHAVLCDRCRAIDLAPQPDDAPIWLSASPGAPVELPRGEFGTAEHPLMLVIGGDLRTSGTTRLFGVVVVRGHWQIDGSVEIHGIVLSSGAVRGRGPLRLFYDPEVAARILGLAFYVKAAGGWSDIDS